MCGRRRAAGRGCSADPRPTRASRPRSTVRRCWCRSAARICATTTSRCSAPRRSTSAASRCATAARCAGRVSTATSSRSASCATPTLEWSPAGDPRCPRRAGVPRTASPRTPHPPTQRRRRRRFARGRIVRRRGAGPREPHRPRCPRPVRGARLGNRGPGRVVRGAVHNSVEGRPLEQPGESALVERARHGDQSAYGELVTRYQAVAARVAYVITASAADAEDVAQDAFVKAYYALDRFREGAPFRPWLLRIVANEAKNRKVAAGRRPTVELTAAADRASSETALSPEDAAVAADLRSGLLAAMSKLREDDRLALTYRYFFDLSEAEMAEALGVARGTVKSRLSRAMGRLREGYADA